MGRGAIGTILAALLFAAPASGAGWLAPTRITTTGETAAKATALAVNADGSAVVAWIADLPDGKHAIRVSQRPADGPFGDPVDAVVDANVIGDFAVATNARGDVLLAWSADSGSESAVSMRPAGGAFSDPAPVVPSGGYKAYMPSAALDGSGRGVVAWYESKNVTDAGCSTIPARTFARGNLYNVAPNGSVTAVGVLGADDGCIAGGGAAVDAPIIAANARGDLITEVRVTFRVRWASRSLATGSLTGFGQTAATSYSPSVDIADSGRYVVGDIESAKPVVRFGVAGAAPGSAIEAGPALTGTDWAVARTAPSADVTVGFTDNPGAGLDYVPFLRSIAADGTPEALGPAVAPQFTAPSFVSPLLDVGAGGTAFMAWLSQEPPADATALRAVVRRAGAAPGAAATISGDLTQNVSSPKLAADGNGGALATFIRPDDAANRIWVTQYDANPPSIAGLDGPASPVSGIPATYTAAVVDDWSGASLHWDFGDGATADGPSVSHTFADPGARTVTVTATDGAGNQASRSLAITVVPPRPVVSGVLITPARFAVARGATAVTARKRVARGTHVRFTLAAAATATVTFQRPAAGRRAKNGHCVKPTAKLRRAKRCKRYRAEGRLTRANLRAGAQDVPFSGRVGRRALRRGRHRVVVAAKGAGGTATGAPRSFTIVRG
jgi:hypothetical protein